MSCTEYTPNRVLTKTVPKSTTVCHLSCRRYSRVLSRQNSASRASGASGAAFNLPSSANCHPEGVNLNVSEPLLSRFGADPESFRIRLGVPYESLQSRFEFVSELIRSLLIAVWESLLTLYRANDFEHIYRLERR